MIPYANFFYFALAGLYVLLPVVLARLVPRTAPAWLKPACILLATALMLVIQYGAVLGEPGPSRFAPIWLVAAYALGQYVLALILLRCRLRWQSKWPGYVSIALALTPLLLVKLLPSQAAAAGPAPPMGAAGLVEFLGLSYVTLRVVDVLVCIHDGLMTQLPAGRYFAFLLFFPTISSGPIDRFRRFSTDWLRRDTRLRVWQDLDAAAHRIFTGFLYKFILAYEIETHWMERIPAKPTLGHTIEYMYAYSGYLFFDFAGYSAFATAFSYLLGMHTPENFQRPFLARNIKDFWTRWHITLSFWFRDFVYLRFTLMAIRGKWFRSKYTAAYLANFLTFGLMGFWHGTAPRYLIYGVYHACLITGHDLFARWNKPHRDAPARVWGDAPAWQIAGVLLTIQAVCFGFLIFSGRRLW